MFYSTKHQMEMITQIVLKTNSIQTSDRTISIENMEVYFMQAVWNIFCKNEALKALFLQKGISTANLMDS